MKYTSQRQRRLDQFRANRHRNEQKKARNLLEIVKSFRAGILGDRPPVDECFKVCSHLSTFLEMNGFNNCLTEGQVLQPGSIPHQHYWITLECGQIVDPTASQFVDDRENQMPEVYFGRLPDWYKPYES